MRFALFLAVCEGEFEIASDTLCRILDVCPSDEFDVYIIDDASPSEVGRALAELGRKKGLHCEVHRLEHSLGFFGCALRLMVALRAIVRSGRTYDFVFKADSDLYPVRSDLGAEFRRICRDRRALYGCERTMRKRDSLLFVADLFPLGFRRLTKDGSIRHDWSLSRFYPTWWNRLGVRAFRSGYRFTFVGGSFWLLGFEALKLMESQGILDKDDSKFGLTVNDDVLLTVMTKALSLDVVDLGALSPAWQGVLSMSERIPFAVVAQSRPFVVHPLKNTPEAWTRRQELRALDAELSPQARASN